MSAFGFKFPGDFTETMYIEKCDYKLIDKVVLDVRADKGGLRSSTS